MSDTAVWDRQFTDQSACRWFPNEELVRFLGRTYGQVVDRPGLGLTAAEIGCGCGGNLVALAAYGFGVDGYDISQTGLHLAKKHLAWCGMGGHVKLVSYAAPDPLPVTDGYYNLIVDIQCIQHLNKQDHMAMYQQILRALKPGGLFFTYHWDEGQHEILFPDHPELGAMDGVAMIRCLDLAGFIRKEMSLVSRGEQHGANGHWLSITSRKPR